MRSSRPPVVVFSLAAMALLLAGGVGLAAQADSPVAVRPLAAITAVTVYPDRALVTRTARMDLAGGSTEVVIEGLPGGLVEASVRATGKGAMAVRITGVDVSREHLARPDDARVRALEAQIRSLQDADRALGDEIQSVQSLQRYLQTVQQKSLEPPKETQTVRIDVEGIRGVFAFLAEGLGGLAKRQREAELSRRDLQERIQKLRRDLQEVRAPASMVRKAVTVGLEAERPGPFELHVSYMLHGARWAPAYEARALLETGEVELTYGARVAQQTGEPWGAVALALSTARPAVGGRAPELEPWALRLLAPPRVAAGAVMMPPAAAAAPREDLARPAPPASDMAERKEVDELRKKTEEAVAATADVVAGGPAVLFKIARPATIPNESREHKTTVAVSRLAGDFSYLAVPKRSPFAYLVARVTPAGDLPILAGPVEVFTGGDYIGRSRLDAAAPGQPFDVHLGVDEGIKVRREELPRERGEGGLFSRTRRTRIAYEIVVENFKRTAEKVTVMDQVPVPTDQEIAVEGLRFSVDPTEKTEKGELKWTFTLQPQEKKVLRVEFTVTHPADRPIAGL